LRQRRHVQSTSDSDLSKDLEKSEYGEKARRVSTEIDEPLPPYRAPTYKRIITGFGGGFIFGKKAQSQGAHRAGMSGRFGQTINGQKRYFGLSKNMFIICCVATVTLILALAIGLGVGLSSGKKAQNLPLPSNKEVHTGDLTYFAPALGACGIFNTDADNIVAVSHLVFDAVQTGSDPNQNPLCGKKIRASRFNEKAGEQRSVDLTVTDRCTGCQPTDIDVTTSVFDQLADRDHGRVVTTWAWLDIDL